MKHCTLLILSLLSLTLAFANVAMAAPAWTPPAVVPNQNLTGKVMCGYQGWFNAPGDGANLGWRHFGPEPGHVGFDMWPDMTEYSADDRYPTNFKNSDGTPATLFSSYNENTVLLHFKWMREYGIDGVFLQRFTSQLSDPQRLNDVDTVLAHVRKGAAEYGRVYGMMYDLSGVKDDAAMQKVMDDWKHLVDTTHLTKDDRYVRDNGKPVVVLWGLGFTGGRKPLLDEGLRFVNFLKNDPVYGGNEVMIGVPYHWRTTDTPEAPFAKMQALIEAADIVSPWAVGASPTPEAAARNIADVAKPDLDWCKAHGKEYMPVVFPGFSWYNLRHGASPSNQIPRLGGRFLWTQYVAEKQAGMTMVYQAMFDEVDEGTAIFKVTDNPPDGAGLSQFVTYEGLPSDFYLKLVGQATRLINGEITPDDDQLIKNAKWTPFVPKLPIVAAAAAPPASAVTLASMSPNPAPPARPNTLEPSDVAAPKHASDGSVNTSWLATHESYLQRAKSAPIGLLFLGDSITNRWRRVPDLWTQHYGQYSPADFGVEGDRTENVLWRIDNGELDGINPKVVVLLLGTNNMGYPADDIVKGDTAVVADIHSHLPNAKVLLLGIFPRGADANNPARAKIIGINAQLAKLDDGNKTRFLDFGGKLLEPNGDLSTDISVDGVHPTPAGYQIWADAMQPLLDEMMR